MVESFKCVLGHTNLPVEPDDSDDEAFTASLGEFLLLLEKLLNVVEAASAGEARNGVVEGEAILDEEAVGGIGFEEEEELVWITLRFELVESRGL